MPTWQAPAKPAGPRSASRPAADHASILAASAAQTADRNLARSWRAIAPVQNPNGAVETTLDLKVDGKKVAGTITSQMGEAKVEGEIADGKLTFWFSMDANGQTLNITFVGTSQKDGSLAGTLSFGQGDLNWTATKAKN